MSLLLSPAKVVLLAAELAAKADVDSLALLAAQHDAILRKELLLRVLLTYLPANLKTADYVSLVQEIETGEFTRLAPVDIDVSRVEQLSDEEATKKARKLRLRKLAWPDAPETLSGDSLVLFLISRAYAVDGGAGSLSELPALLAPFLDHHPYIRSWTVSTLLPLLRRNFEYYPERPIAEGLSSFERLPDRVAVTLLLSQTGQRDEDLGSVGRDLRGLVGPWLYNSSRWKAKKKPTANDGSGALSVTSASTQSPCPGWEELLQWLTTQAFKSWRVAVGAVEQWDGPADVDLGGYGTMWLNEKEQAFLEQRYARAAIASAYLIPESSEEALTGAYNIATRIADLLDQDPSPSLAIALSLLSPVQDLAGSGILSAQNATHLRNDMLEEENILTTPSRTPTILLHALILSAFVLSRAECPCTVRRAGELALLQNEREQKAESTKLVRSLSENAPAKGDDKYWMRSRDEILWLRDWGAEETSEPTSGESGIGVFGRVKKEFLELEILKALLRNGRYSLARSLYEDPTDAPLSPKTLQDAVFAAAMNAYDNASNPSPLRGGLKRCNDIINAFPKTVEGSAVAARRIEALLKATDALSDYRLVLKQGEPFMPVVLRVHPDPISIVGKVVEQNPKSYTRIQELLDVGIDMVAAGLTVRDKTGHSTLRPEQEPTQRAIAEKRITAMCIDGALTEDDFETAYSYVVGRLAPAASPSTGSVADEWSWKAALQAGKYKRTARTTRPTHLGTASANLEIRHLEQRIECLATALRVAPAATLQEILNSYRRCEEELDAAVQAEEATENAWDDAADEVYMPGGFGLSASRAGGVPSRARAAGGGGNQGASRGEDAPLSLFDLSRATARAAQRNLTALSSLQRSGQARLDESQAPHQEHGQQRARRRDQFREAAVGTLTSGVGWLIGAQPLDRNREAE